MTNDDWYHHLLHHHLLLVAASVDFDDRFVGFGDVCWLLVVDKSRCEGSIQYLASDRVSNVSLSLSLEREREEASAALRNGGKRKVVPDLLKLKHMRAHGKYPPCASRDDEATDGATQEQPPARRSRISQHTSHITSRSLSLSLLISAQLRSDRVPSTGLARGVEGRGAGHYLCRVLLFHWFRNSCNARPISVLLRQRYPS